MDLGSETSRLSPGHRCHSSSLTHPYAASSTLILVALILSYIEFLSYLLFSDGTLRYHWRLGSRHKGTRGIMRTTCCRWCLVFRWVSTFLLFHSFLIHSISSAPMPLPMSIHSIQNCSKLQRRSSCGLDTTASRRINFGNFVRFNFFFKNVEDAVGMDWFWWFIGMIGWVYCWAPGSLRSRVLGRGIGDLCLLYFDAVLINERLKVYWKTTSTAALKTRTTPSLALEICLVKSMFFHSNFCSPTFKNLDSHNRLVAPPLLHPLYSVLLSRMNQLTSTDLTACTEPSTE